MNKINMYDLEPSELGAMLDLPVSGDASAKLDLQKKCDKFSGYEQFAKRL